MYRFFNKKCGLSILLLFVALYTSAQQWSIVAHRLDSTARTAPLIMNNQYRNNQDIITELRKIVPKLQEQGYLSASIDSIDIRGAEYNIYYYQGQQYRWAKLLFDSIPSAVLVSAAINPRQFSDRPLNPKHIATICERIIKYNEENGYPFVKVWLSNVIETKPEMISAHLKIERSELRTIDTIIVNGDVKISNVFIQRYLDILKGSVYDEKKLKMINQKIMELPFLQQVAPWVMVFKPGNTRLSLFLKEKKANQLNAILGLMPNNLQTGKLLVTADVQIALQNLIGYGESISTSYQNLQARSPRLKTDAVVPFVLKTPIGVEAHFDMFKNDLQFRKVTFQTGFRYHFNSSDILRLYYQTMGNRLITVDTANIIATKQLPNNIDVRSSGIGVEINLNRTDYKLNPHKGWYARISATAFKRKILTNAAIGGINDGTGFDYNSLYDTIIKSSYIYHINAELAKFIALNKVLTLKLAYSGALISAPNVFQNELFQIGGFKLLRGFDEQSIFANQYHITIAELRLRLSQNSYTYLFSDNGWVQSRFNNYDRTSWYNGFGLGTSLETKTGIFSIALAFGKSEFNPLKFRESKLSFGYVALF